MDNNQFTMSRFLPLIRVITILMVLLIGFKVAIFLLPFVISFLVVTLTRPIAKFFIEKLKLKSKFAIKLSLTIFYLIIILILFKSFFVIVNELYSIVSNIILNGENIKNNILKLINNYSLSKEYINTIFYTTFIKGIDKLLSSLTTIGFNFVNYLFNILSKAPVIFVYVMITVTASYMMADNIEKVTNFFNKQFPKSWISKFIVIRKDVIDVMFKYFKTQLFLITLCFLELLIGLNIINLFVYQIDYIFILAVLIALVDALPILGTGTILIPWVLISLISGNYTLAVSLIILYLIIFTLRVILEPRLVSNNLSLDPLLSLLAMFVGFKIFGVIGFLVGPIIMTIFMVLFEEEIKNGFFKILAGEE